MEDVVQGELAWLELCRGGKNRSEAGRYLVHGSDRNDGEHADSALQWEQRKSDCFRCLWKWAATGDYGCGSVADLDICSDQCLQDAAGHDFRFGRHRQ